MGKIFRCLSGSVTILVRGNQLERFLNLCRSRNISMEHIRRKEGQITARIKIRDFFRLRPVRNKTGVHIQVTEKQGMPFFFYEAKKGRLFLQAFHLDLYCCFSCQGGSGTFIFREMFRTVNRRSWNFWKSRESVMEWRKHL